MSDEEGSGLRNRKSPTGRASPFDEDEQELADFTDSSYKTSRKRNEIYPDPIADSILAVYKSIKLDEYEILRYALAAAPLVLILLFYIFVSKSTSCMISFTAFTFSIVFMGISMLILCEILNKDIGPKSM